ncbi:MAG: hypothetical protein RIG82_10510 [Phycisphaeraceae bacterium]
MTRLSLITCLLAMHLITAIPVFAQDGRWESVAIIEINATDKTLDTVTAAALLQDVSLAAKAAPRLRNTALGRSLANDPARIADAIDGFITARRLVYDESITSRHITNMIRLEVWTENEDYSQDVDNVAEALIHTLTEVLDERHRSELALEQILLQARIEATRRHLDELAPDEEGNLLSQAVTAQIEGPLPKFRTQLRSEIYRHELELEVLKQRIQASVVRIVVPPSPPINQ